MNKIAFRLAALFACSLVPAGFSQPAAVQIAPAKPSAAPAKPVLKGFPYTNESLFYTANWPSGLSLGEAHMSATASPGGWRFQLDLDAAIPSFAVKDTFQSTSSPDLCSQTFHKEFVHGSHKANETVTVDKDESVATRTPANGISPGKMPVPGCIRDALSFLFYTRRELGQGRVPPAQEIIFGAIYNASFEYAGAATIIIANKSVVTDKMICHVKGPASDITFDAYFDRDAARTPLSIKVPLPLGKFSLELVR